jgi:hypothetical protein
MSVVYLVYSPFDNTLPANVERLLLTGGAVSGTGNVLGNELSGNFGNNTLYGLDGNDTLMG